MSLKQAFEEIKKQDLEIVKEWLEENINELHYNKEKEVWLIDGVEIVDELWYEQKTNIHPKSLMSDINKLIEEEIMNTDKNRKNYAKIVLIDGHWDYEVYFDEIYENPYYTIIDKQLIGQKIRKELCEEYDGFDNFIDKINGEFDDNFVDEVLVKIEEDVVNKIRDEICQYVLYDEIDDFEYVNQRIIELVD